MIGVERSWDDLHHWPYFLPGLCEVDSNLYTSISNGNVYKILNRLAPSHIFIEGNMSNISKTIMVNISINPNVIENIFIRYECSPNEIKTYINLFK